MIMHTNAEGDAGEKTRAEPPPHTAIEYAQSQFQVTRRQWRVLMTLTLLNTLLLGWFVVGPDSTRFIQAQWQQFQARRAEKAKLGQMLADQQQCLRATTRAGADARVRSSRV
jgi:hypothetical protein